MIFATGGTVLGEISMRSRLLFLASFKASAIVITPRFAPSSVMTRSCGAFI